MIIKNRCLDKYACVKKISLLFFALLEDKVLHKQVILPQDPGLGQYSRRDISSLPVKGLIKSNKKKSFARYKCIKNITDSKDVVEKKR